MIKNIQYDNLFSTSVLDFRLYIFVFQFNY